jgi:hypothetical protein
MVVAGRTDRAWVFLEALVALAVVAAVIGTSYGPAATVGFILVGTALAATAFFLSKMIGALGDEGLDVPRKKLDEDRIRLEAEKVILLQGIKEFEADAGVGKVDRADYEHLRKTAEGRALEIIRVLKDDDSKWMRAAEALVEKRTGKATAKPITLAKVDTIEMKPVEGGVRCSACDRVSDADARFCTGCGRRRAA